MQLVELQEKLAELESLGARVYAIAPDDAEALAELAETGGIGFPILDDPGGETVLRYGVRNPFFTDRVIPHPTVVVVDRQGRIGYLHLDEDYTRRPPASALVEAVRQQGEEGPGG